MKYFLDKHLDGIGVEGYTEAINCSPVSGNIIKHDYTTGPLVPSSEFDLGWCYEFVEHVKEEFIDNFMQTFSRCKHVAMTHGVPGQSGFHHVNCQLPQYWIDVFEEYNFEYLECESLNLRNYYSMKMVAGNQTEDTLEIH